MRHNFIPYSIVGKAHFTLKPNVRLVVARKTVPKLIISHWCYAAAMDPQMIGRKPDTASMAYTNCNTRIISLTDLDLPSSASTTEEEYKQLYDRISRSKSPQAQQLTDAVNSIRLGIAPPVAFPTETVYGLGADATNRASCAGIFAAKGRPSDNPLIVHVASKEHLERLTGAPIPAVYSKLVDEYWPGPLTILVPVPDAAQSPFAENVHPGQRTIGFRVPDSKYARFFIAATGRPLAAPSANSSGKPSPTRAQHVKDDLDGKINFVLDGGSCSVGVESTVVDGLHDPPLILRPGGVSLHDLITHGKKHNNVFRQTRLGYKESHDHDTAQPDQKDEAPRAPGMKYKHYAPRGQLTLFEGTASQQQATTEFQTLVNELSTSPSQPTSEPEPISIAILTSTSWSPYADLPSVFDTLNIERTGQPDNKNEIDSTTAATTTVPKTMHITYTPIRTTNIPIKMTLTTISLGTSPKQVAQSLFATLRTCDSLQCRYIFAEAPQNPASTPTPTSSLTNGDTPAAHVNGTFDTPTSMSTSTPSPPSSSTSVDTADFFYGAVIERMRKAATRRVV